MNLWLELYTMLKQMVNASPQFSQIYSPFDELLKPKHTDTDTHTHTHTHMIMGNVVLRLTDTAKGIISKLLFYITNDYNEFFFLNSLLGYLSTTFRIQIFLFIDNNSTLTIPSFTVTSWIQKTWTIVKTFMVWSNNMKCGMAALGDRQFPLCDFMPVEFSCHNLTQKVTVKRGYYLCSISLVQGTVLIRWS